ncbi:hypothetical protein Tco_0136507 [Tanacetum coccineum]
MVTLAFKHQEQYEHVGPKVTRSQEGKDYKMAKRYYAWLMISICSKDQYKSRKRISRKMVTLAFKHQEQYEHVGPEVTRSQEGKDFKMVILCLVDNLNMLKRSIQVKKKIQAKA